MTSVASPGFTRNLKKRTRTGSLLGAENYELNSLKRYRGMDQTEENKKDSSFGYGNNTTPAPSHPYQFYENELHRVRSEYENHLTTKEYELQALKTEILQLRENNDAQGKEYERIQNENKLLKRAVTIQNQQKEEVQQENQQLKQFMQQGAEHIKRLEQSNYALRVHLQATQTNGLEHANHQPDVY